MCRIHTKASFWLYQPDDVVLYYLTSELNRQPVSESGAGGQPERYHTRLAAGTHYSNATVVLPWIATAQNEPLRTLAIPTAPPHVSANLWTERSAFDRGGAEELAKGPRLHRAQLNDRLGHRTEVVSGAD